MGLLDALLPKEKLFFELFAKLAKKGVDVCEAFEKMLDDMGNVGTHVRRIKSLEHEADEITHATVEAVHRTFVTPIDRDDIHRLASRLDDVVDLVDAAAARMELYEIREIHPDCRDMAKVLTQAARLLPKAVAALETSRKSPKAALEASSRSTGWRTGTRSRTGPLRGCSARSRTSALLKLEGGLREPRVGDRPLRGRCKPDRGHRHRAGLRFRC